MKRYKLIVLAAIGVVCFGVFAMFFLQVTNNEEVKDFKITESMSKESFDAYVKQEFGITMPLGFSFWAEKAGFKIQNCKFQLESKTTTWGLLTLLRQNRNQTVNIVIPPGIYIDDFAKILAKNLFVNSDEVIDFINSSEFYDLFELDKYNWPALIIPNTYNVALNTGLTDFFSRMKKENSLFWNEQRLSQLRKQKLTLAEAVNVASIVQKESLKADEYGLIAGVYLNRLRINMPLGADPTLVFIRGKGGRVYKKDILRNSPFNTYLNKGLPPGPICIPSKAAIDAVLNYDKHPYLYFCANSDLSGYHIFEKDYKKHLINARKFQKVLDNQKGS